MEFSKRQNDAIVAEKTKNERISTQRDMSKIYYMLGRDPKYLLKKCPILFCDLDIDDDYLTFKTGESTFLIATRKGLSNEDILKIVSGNTKNYIGKVQAGEGLDGYDTPYNMANFYLLVAMLAKAMEISCPQIFIRKIVANNAIDVDGYIEYCDDQGLTKIILYENPAFNTIDMLLMAAHEMRHWWQHETCKEKFLSNYEMPFDNGQVCEDRYLLQLAEIDAFAYALRFIEASTGRSYSVSTLDPIVKQEIERYAKTLDDSLFEPFTGMYR